MIIFIVSQDFGQFPKAIKMTTSHNAPENTDLLTENASLKAQINKKALLLILSTELAQVKAKQELTRLLQNRLPAFFDFKHFSIILLDDNTHTFSYFLADQPITINEHQNYWTRSTQDKDISAYYKMITANSGAIFSMEHLVHSKHVPQYIEHMHQSGIRQTMSISLKYESKTLGVFSVYSEHSSDFREDFFPLLQSISEQISSAIVNILSAEAIENKIAEREALLSISDAIARVKNRNELLAVVNGPLKRLFTFSHSVVLKLSNDSKFLSSYILDPDSKNRVHPQYETIAAQQFPSRDPLLSTALAAKGPSVFNITREALKVDVQPYMKMFLSVGFKEFMTVPLHTPTGVPLGIIAFFNETDNCWGPEVLRIIKSISIHIATAMSNITFLEEIQLKDTQNEILLAVSTAISSIKDKHEMIQSIHKTLKRYLNFSDITLTIFNVKKGIYKPYLFYCEKCIMEAGYDFITAQQYPLYDGLHDWALSSEKVNVVTVASMLPQDLPNINFIHRAGIKELACVRLQNSSEVLGAMVLLSDCENAFSEEQKAFMQRLSHHMSTMVSNFIATEKLEAREQEKSLLLTFSNDIAAIRDKEGLTSVISHYFTHVFKLDHYLLTVRNKDASSHCFYLFNLPEVFTSSKQFEEISKTDYSIHGGLTEIVVNSGTPVLFNLQDLSNETAHNPGFFWQTIGLESLLGVPLKVGNENIGVLWTCPDKVKEELLQGISSQIAFALANIQANARIEQQLGQISNYKEQLEEEKTYLQQEVNTNYSYNNIIGTGPAMQEVFNLLSQVSFANSTVLILGETGTGKELIARALHQCSSRKDNLMVKVNCAALPPSLIESELFGHERGSFTGARERRIGKFELANRGTLFLDEIGEMPLELQVKLLRALQEKEIERVGGQETIKIDVRIIAATNRDLEKEVDEGRFRKDLFYRLNVFPILLPALRDHTNDIPTLAMHFVAKFAKNNGKKTNKISNEVIKELCAYDWPGNVRELEHMMERAVLMTKEHTISEIHLPHRKNNMGMAGGIYPYKTHEQNERDHIIEALKKCKGKVFGAGGAAELLDIKVTTLNSIIKRLGIKKEEAKFN